MTAPLARRLGLGDAVLLAGLAVAAVVALCNATASAQLAAQYPTSGGTYVYGRERLGDWWGFLAGWGFVVGKTASCAAMALVFGAYAAPDGREQPGRRAADRGGRRRRLRGAAVGRPAVLRLRRLRPPGDPR